MKKIWLFALSMFTFSCSANQNLEPKSVTLIYEKAMLTAEIQTDNNFKAHINNEKKYQLFGFSKEYSFKLPDKSLGSSNRQDPTFDESN